MTRIILTLCSLLVFAATSLHGQIVTVSGHELEIGVPGTNQVQSYVVSGGVVVGGGGAIGSQNNVTDYYDRGSLAVGINNGVNGGVSSAFGNGNQVGGYASVAIGISNNLMSTYEDGVSSTSLLVGSYNYLEYNAHSSIVSGVNNVVGGYGMPLLEATATFGRGLLNSTWSNATLVGQYNSGGLLGGLILFAVGNGADASNRSNALEVYTDGTVVLRKRQGDILMGEFGNGDQ